MAKTAEVPGGSSLTSGSLRSLILMFGVPSIFEVFKNKTITIDIPRTQAAAPTTKVKSVVPQLPKSVQEAAAAGRAIDAAQQGPGGGEKILVDMGERKKNPASYGAVFTSEPDDGDCWHCRRKVKPDKKVGIVLRVRDDRFHHLLIIDIEGTACNSRCALKFIRDHIGEHICYQGRETAMHQINEICAPGTQLVAARDWRLLKINKGPMDDEEFDGETREYLPTPNLQYRLCSLTFGPS